MPASASDSRTATRPDAGFGRTATPSPGVSAGPDSAPTTDAVVRHTPRTVAAYSTPVRLTANWFVAHPRPSAAANPASARCHVAPLSSDRIIPPRGAEPTVQPDPGPERPVGRREHLHARPRSPRPPGAGPSPRP